jgi:hypothetical protein
MAMDFRWIMNILGTDLATLSSYHRSIISWRLVSA